MIETATLSVAAGRRAAGEIADLPARQRPTAVFCANDLLALGVLQEMTQRGVRVPRDIAIVGYDDIEFAAAAAVRSRRCVSRASNWAAPRPNSCSMKSTTTAGTSTGMSCSSRNWWCASRAAARTGGPPAPPRAADGSRRAAGRRHIAGSERAATVRRRVSRRPTGPRRIPRRAVRSRTRRGRSSRSHDRARPTPAPASGSGSGRPACGGGPGTSGDICVMGPPLESGGGGAGAMGGLRTSTRRRRSTGRSRRPCPGTAPGRHRPASPRARPRRTGS